MKEREKKEVVESKMGRVKASLGSVFLTGPIMAKKELALVSSFYKCS